MKLFLKIPRVQRAFQYMVIAHQNQKYGEDLYFTHPLEVANQVVDPSEDEIIVALLHDIIEDTPINYDNIMYHFGDTVAKAVNLLSKDHSKSYQENIDNIITSGNITAIKVKWADNYVNMHSDKSQMDSTRRDKLNDRYALSFLKLSKVLGI